jgi:hypothetical protein
MKWIIMMLALGVVPSAYADFYSCRAEVAGKSYLTLVVDTSRDFEYFWMFPGVPEAEPSCSAAKGSGALKCSLNVKTPNGEKVFATAEIGVGDKSLILSSPAYLNGAGGNIKCVLEH